MGEASVSLSVNGFGTMTYNSGSGRYVLATSSASNPGTVTVVSDLGGAATSNVRRR